MAQQYRGRVGGYVEGSHCGGSARRAPSAHAVRTRCTAPPPPKGAGKAPPPTGVGCGCLTHKPLCRPCTACTCTSPAKPPPPPKPGLTSTCGRATHMNPVARSQGSGVGAGNRVKPMVRQPRPRPWRMRQGHPSLWPPRLHCNNGAWERGAPAESGCGRHGCSPPRPHNSSTGIPSGRSMLRDTKAPRPLDLGNAMGRTPTDRQQTTDGCCRTAKAVTTGLSDGRLV